MQSGTRHPASRFLICLAFLQCVSHQVCRAHPTSHVDAWVRVGTQIDVRLTLFLDDVFATQDRFSSPAEALISEADARNVLANFKTRLPELFSVYDVHGRLLPAAHMQSPRWKIPLDGVDLQADAGLRLTWEISYDWPSESTSFSVRHTFTQHRSGTPLPGSKSVLPAELRLRVRCDSSGRRFDSVISHHLPHTIVLPRALPEAYSRQNEVPATATFVLLPNQLIHEFSIPLLLAPFMDDSQHTLPDLPMTDEDNRTAVDLSETIALTESWAKANLSLIMDDALSVPETYSVQLLTAENKPLPASAPVPFVGTRLGIRSIHTVSHAPTSVSVQWTGLSPDVRQVVLHSQAGSTAQTQIIHQLHSDSEVSYNWTVPRSPVGDSNPSTSPFAATDRPTEPNSFWQQDTPAGWVWPGACISLLTGICISVAGSNTRRRIRKPGIAIAIGSGLVMAAIAHWSGVHPDSDSAALLLDSMLKHIYRSTLIEQDELRVEHLSSVLTEDLVETLHEQLAAATKESDSSPLIQIDGVQLTKCTTRSFVAATSADFECEWQVSGQVLHWGHRHQRQLQLAGTIQLDTTDDRIRISQISLENVQQRDIGNAQTNSSHQRFLTSRLSSLSEVRKTCNRQGDN